MVMQVDGSRVGTVVLESSSVSLLGHSGRAVIHSLLTLLVTGREVVMDRVRHKKGTDRTSLSVGTAPKGMVTPRSYS